MNRYKLFFLILLICCFQNSFSQNKINYGDNPAAGKYYSIRGIKMYCEIYGSGKPLLMIHGNGGSIKAFENNIPYFAKKYKVIAVDSRSQGKSEDNKDSLSFEMMADDFAVLLDTLHVDSAYVIGWSDGGINALLLAMRHPEKVIKLVSTGANLCLILLHLYTVSGNQKSNNMMHHTIKFGQQNNRRMIGNYLCLTGINQTLL